MEIPVSFPENLFDESIAKINKLKFDLVKNKLVFKQEKELMASMGRQDSASLEIIKRRFGTIKKEIEAIKQRIDLYWDYTLLRSIAPHKMWFDNKTFSAELSEFLGISRRDINKRKVKIIRAGWAVIVNDRLYWHGKDTVWRSFGVLVADHKVDEEGKRIAHQKLGVYKIVGEKKVKKMKGQINPKNGKPYNKDHVFIFEKKVDVKVIKFKIEKHQLNKIDLKRQAALAVFKHQTDRQVSRQTEQQLRETNQDSEVQLSCQYIAEKVGYISAGSGWHLRNELSDCGFISVCPKKIIVEENITYEAAAEKYQLQKGIQEATGLAYFYDKVNQNVWGTSCFGIMVNGYNGIDYRANRVQKPKKEPKRWIPFNLQVLMSCNGWKVRKIWEQFEFLFEDANISDYLTEEIGMGNIFSFSDFQSRNSKLAASIPTS